MTDLFLKLVNMSITAGWIVLAVVLLRLAFQKSPRWIHCILWGMVGLRLVLPVSLESILSLIPSAETIPQDIVYTDTPAVHSGVLPLNSTINPILAETMTPQAGDSVNPMQVVVAIATAVWLVGVAAMAVYAVISYWRIKTRTREGVKLHDNVYLCDRIDTPFILGVVKPKVYLPCTMQESDREYVIAHETAHLKRFDHLWKPLGFVLLSVYWFHPLLWVAYILLCRDIELACDEKVMKEQGEAYKKPYAEALINCSVPRRMIAACPLAFGEVNVKNRIKSILNYKKPAFWIIVVSLVAVAVAAVCLLTNPVDDTPAGGETKDPVTTTTTTTTTQTTVGTTTKAADTTNKTTATTKPAPQYNGPVTYEPLEIKAAPYIHEDADDVNVANKVELEDKTLLMLQFDNYKDVLAFEKAYRKLDPLNKDFCAISKEYNETFFETKALVLVSGWTSWSGQKVDVGKVSCDGKKFVAEIRSYDADPHYMHDCMSVRWGYAFVMDKRAMEKVTTFDAYRTVVPYDISTCYAGDIAIEIEFTPAAAAKKPDLSPTALSEKFGIEIDWAIDASDLEYESAYSDVLLFVSERDPEKLDKMVEKVGQHPDIEGAYLDLHPEEYAEANFEEGKVLVTLTPEATEINRVYTPAELTAKFGVTITAVEDLSRLENEDALNRIDKDAYCQILSLEIPQTGKQAVLDACTIIEQHKDVKSASPNYFWYDDIDW